MSLYAIWIRKLLTSCCIQLLVTKYRTAIAMTYRICSINEGGVKGIIPATIIKEMLRISKSLGGKGDITDLCDYVMGMSAGGIVGAALVVSEKERKLKFTQNKF